MKTYGLEKKHLDFIKKSINKVFKKNQLPKVYIFGSRSQGTQRKNSDIDLAIKGKEDISEKVDLLAEIFEDSDLPYKVDIMNWDDILDDYKPSINKQKKLLWSPEQKEKSHPWRACPIGEHWVRRHNKTSKSGKIGDWDGHCRKNRSGKDILKGDEIEVISESDFFKKAKPKVSRKKIDYPNENDFNHLITGWTAYWNSIFKLKDPLHPNYVKALIASESGFSIRSQAPNALKVGYAQGLVQLTEQTQKILKDSKGELRDHFVVLKKNEQWDANKNIAAAIRWLFRKRETAKARLKREPSWEEVIYEYKGILTQKALKSKKIKFKYRELLKKLNGND